ncbi:extracellular solute-binding protein [Paenibacillus sp. KQZ6P-2]|uniref:Extracellular solute-binding protein n=1 Tax=Paenibacillus mangrovi TaxID=2931978 RepID=A0A9X1WRI6_9BACL|nr:extracellular solute-binding protein [Paenibacillus mangrovi]MCJ8012095.1 extracellular solute-binding protein [Paenibacillus mangrovi]
MKKRAFWFMTLAMLLVIFSGCSSRPDGGSISASGGDNAETGSGKIGSGKAKTTLSMMVNISDESLTKAYREIVDGFTKENPDISVNLQFDSNGYENTMKVKMAANDLPDIFDTHGWAKIRYGEYLADLRDEPWASQLTDTIRNVVTDENGKVYALVLTEAKDGMLYNVDMLEKYGIEVPRTFDELVAAGEKIKKESGGKTIPFYLSGIDDSTIGQYLDQFANPLLITAKNNEADALLKGTFDWSHITPLAQSLLTLKEKGLINEDVLTAKRSDLPAAFAAEKVTFALVGPAFMDSVHEIAPNMKIGIMPLPAMVAGDEPTFAGGERNTLAVWKDSKHLDEAKKLLQYFAKPENMAKLSNVSKNPPGLKDIKTDHELTPYYDKYASIRVFPYFDRVYLPNGMWDVLCKNGTELLAGRMTPEQFSESMKTEVERLSKK